MCCVWQFVKIPTVISNNPVLVRNLTSPPDDDTASDTHTRTQSRSLSLMSALQELYMWLQYIIISYNNLYRYSGNVHLVLCTLSNCEYFRELGQRELLLSSGDPPPPQFHRSPSSVYRVVSLGQWCSLNDVFITYSPCALWWRWGPWRYMYVLKLPAALTENIGQHHAPAALTLRTAWASEPV